MGIVKSILAVALVLYSLFVGLVGVVTYSQSLGQVFSTEFNLLIGINGQLGLIMGWVALFGVWSAIPYTNRLNYISAVAKAPEE